MISKHLNKMKRLIGWASVLSVFLALASCGGDSIYSGFKKMESGAYMQFYTTNEGQMPRLNDEVTFHMAQVFDDSLLYSSFGDEPMHLVLKKADFVGDVPDALLMMHEGDSARLVVAIDSVFITMMGMEEVPEEYAGKPIYYDLKLCSIRPFEELEAERKALLNGLKQEEIDFLAPLVLDPKHSLTESGLIIMEKTGSGKVARMGDYVNFDFTMCSPKGDTIMNSFGVESVDMQYGEEFISKGFNEAIGMVPEGGTMRFVVPSELAFDSTGYEQFIPPYTPLVVLMKMNSVMDKASYDQHQADLEAAKGAEVERILAAETVRIANYVKANNIIETPTESGIYIIRQEEGKGNVAQWGDQVSVHYILSNLDGDVVDSSYDYGEPMHFTMGKGEMIPAIEEALMTMAPGAKVTVVTPSSQGFADIAIDEKMPAYSPLVIELELVEIK